MTNTTAPIRLGIKMSIRVYTVGPHGLITQDRGTVAVVGHHERATSPLNTPCTCPRCPTRQPLTE